MLTFNTQMQLHKEDKEQTQMRKASGEKWYGTFWALRVAFRELMREMFARRVGKQSQTINVPKRSESKSNKNTKAFLINPRTA